MLYVCKTTCDNVKRKALHALLQGMTLSVIVVVWTLDLLMCIFQRFRPSLLQSQIISVAYAYLNQLMSTFLRLEDPLTVIWPKQPWLAAIVTTTAFLLPALALTTRSFAMPRANNCFQQIELCIICQFDAFVLLALGWNHAAAKAMCCRHVNFSVRTSSTIALVRFLSLPFLCYPSSILAMNYFRYTSVQHDKHIRNTL